MAKIKQTKKTLFQFMNTIITQLLKNGQHRTMQHYKTTLNTYTHFRRNRDIALSEINTEEIRAFKAYLKNVVGVCNNTSSFYLRILRATYNKAVEKGLTIQRTPFRNVYTGGIGKPRKRAIPTASVCQIKRMDSTQEFTPKQELARDTFLLCFYLRGISFIDLAHLRKSDLKDGYLHYTRSKTGQRLTIRWEKEMQEIVDKYKSQTAFSPYLLPFLTGNNHSRQNKATDTRQEELRLYHNAETRMAYHLKKLGARIGLPGKLTLYVARHSWATAARDRHIAISVISEALGHHSEATTQIYLRSITARKWMMPMRKSWHHCEI